MEDILYLFLCFSPNTKTCISLCKGLVKIVEDTVRNEHVRSPNRPIYLLGDSFGGCLALAIAARNPNIDLVLVLSNPGENRIFSFIMEKIFRGNL